MSRRAACLAVGLVLCGTLAASAAWDSIQFGGIEYGPTDNSQSLQLPIPSR
jgi:hypothetical protein